VPEVSGACHQEINGRTAVVCATMKVTSRMQINRSYCDFNASETLVEVISHEGMCVTVLRHKV
jgi:hypothetical protein